MASIVPRPITPSSVSRWCAWKFLTAASRSASYEGAIDGGRFRQLAGDQQACADRRDARIGGAGLERRAGRNRRPAAGLGDRARPRQRLLQALINEVIRLECLDAGVDARRACDLIERHVECRRAKPRVDIPALVERRGEHPPVADMIDQRSRRVRHQHLDLGGNVGGR
jgi:hypothetical protein